VSPAKAKKPRMTRAARSTPVVADTATAVVPAPMAAALPDGWREFVGRWLEDSTSAVRPAARGDWEVDLSESLRKRWRRQRVRMVFDPQRATLPRGAWFTAPASSAGRRILDLATAEPAIARRTALAHVPGAPENGFAAVCRIRGLSWGPPRLGPVRYERRVSVHAVATRWGGMPGQEPWVVCLGPDGGFMEWSRGFDVPDVRTRDGLYQIPDDPDPEERARWMAATRDQLGRILVEHEHEWELRVSMLRDEELSRLGAFFSSRIEEEEERQRRRAGNGDELDEQADATSLKLEWERRAAEVRQRWALRTEVRLWGVVEWSWPVATLEQELRSGAVHVRVAAAVDVARGRPSLPPCPGCGRGAELLVRARGGVGCEHCADR
jgi:hypothetical protein